MKKYFALAVLAAMTLSGCIKEDNTYKEWQTVQPGAQIRYWAQIQNDVALKPASMAFRLGMLLAEAVKQNPGTELKDIDLSTLAVNKVSLMSKLFGSAATITFVDEGYKLTFVETAQFPDSYYYKGSLLIHTNGAALLGATSQSAVWEVTLQDFKTLAYSSSSGSTSTITYENCNTEVYNNGDGSYTARASAVRSYINELKQRSNWTTTFSVTPADESLAYSECAGKDFKVTGKGAGPSFASFDYAGSSTQLSYEIDGRYRTQLAFIDGTETALLTGYGDYDTTTFPAREVIYRWTFNESTSKYSYVIYYNNYTYPKQ